LKENTDSISSLRRLKKAACGGGTTLRAALRLLRARMPFSDRRMSRRQHYPDRQGFDRDECVSKKEIDL
jgi:hypothetical protein